MLFRALHCLKLYVEDYQQNQRTVRTRKVVAREKDIDYARLRDAKIRLVHEFKPRFFAAAGIADHGKLWVAAHDGDSYTEALDAAVSTVIGKTRDKHLSAGAYAVVSGFSGLLSHLEKEEGLPTWMAKLNTRLVGQAKIHGCYPSVKQILALQALEDRVQLSFSVNPHNIAKCYGLMFCDRLGHVRKLLADIPAIPVQHKIDTPGVTFSPSGSRGATW